MAGALAALATLETCALLDCASAAPGRAPDPRTGTWPSGRPSAMAPVEQDSHSFARTPEARVTHLALDLVPDFSTRTVAGQAVLTIAAAPGAGMGADARFYHALTRAAIEDAFAKAPEAQG